MSVRKSLYLITYVSSDGEEEVMEIPAFSSSQAVFLADKDCVINVERTMNCYEVSEDFEERRCMA